MLTIDFYEIGILLIDDDIELPLVRFLPNHPVVWQRLHYRFSILVTPGNNTCYKHWQDNTNWLSVNNLESYWNLRMLFLLILQKSFIVLCRVSDEGFSENQQLSFGWFHSCNSCYFFTLIMWLQHFTSVTKTMTNMYCKLSEWNTTSINIVTNNTRR